MRSIPGATHDRDDLLDLRRVGRVAQTLVSWRVAGVESRQRRRRSTSTGAVEQELDMTPPRARENETRLSAPVNAADPAGPPRYRFQHRAAVKADPRQVSRLPPSDSAVAMARPVAWAAAF